MSGAESEVLMIAKAFLSLILMTLTVAGCSANRYSINRKTALPNNSGNNGGRGVAIHLDAQQRLVLTNSKGIVCAEPSPDAMTTFAASFGAGAAVPDRAAASVAQALQGSIGSIGLRTQSITLMRDALYRMCEAYANEKIDAIQLATFYTRSQDLTAVILAVEQLTGAVAANQVVLAGSSNANAMASLTSNQALLETAQKEVDAKKKALAEATTERDAARAELDKAEAEHLRLVTAHKNAVSSKSENEGALLKERDAAQKVRDSAAGTLNEKEAARKSLEKSLVEAERTLDVIRAARESALTNAMAAASGSGDFSTPVARNQLDKEATTAIAAAVEKMVTSVVTKSYVTELCLAFLTADTSRTVNATATTRVAELNATRTMCHEVVTRGLSDPGVRRMLNLP